MDKITQPENDPIKQKVFASEDKLTQRQQALISNVEKQVRLAFKHSNQKSYGSRDKYRDASLRFARHIALVWSVQNMRSVRNPHIQSYVTEMMDDDLSVSYIKSELSAIRHMLRLVDCKNNIYATNNKFHVPKRESIVFPGSTLEEYKEAQDLAKKKFGIVGKLTVDLQFYFGERINESQAMRSRRIIDAYDNGVLHLGKVDGTKGGRARNIPVVTAEQGQVIANAIAYYEQTLDAVC